MRLETLRFLTPNNTVIITGGVQMVFESLRRIFARDHIYTLYLNRRGRPLEIETFRAKNIKEAVEIAQQIIEDLDPNQIPDLTKYKTFRLVEDGEKVKFIKNPFFQEEEEDISPEMLEKVTIASIINRIPKVIDNSIEMITTIQSTIMSKVMETSMDALLKVFRKQLGLEHEPTENLKLLIELIKHRKELSELVKEFKKQMVESEKEVKQSEGGE